MKRIENIERKINHLKKSELPVNKLINIQNNVKMKYRNYSELTARNYFNNVISNN